MSTINVHEIQHDPVGFLKRVEAGETLLVVRDDRPVAEVKPVSTNRDRPLPADAPFSSAEEWSHALREWAASHPHRDQLADDSRESIYAGRGE